MSRARAMSEVAARRRASTGRNTIQPRVATRITLTASIAGDSTRSTRSGRSTSPRPNIRSKTARSESQRPTWSQAKICTTATPARLARTTVPRAMGTTRPIAPRSVAARKLRRLASR